MTKSTNAVPSAHPVLETRDLTVRFGGHVAVNAVSCAFHAGSLTAIVGPNGAGKTTYFNLISGQIPSTAGEVFMFGENISKLAPPLRTRRGIGRAFQLTNLFPFLTTLENIRIAVQARAGIGLDLWSMWSSHKDLLEKAEYILEQVALTHQRFTVAKELADRIIVLHNGTLVADGEPSEVIASAVVQEAYLGVAPDKSKEARA